MIRLAFIFILTACGGHPGDLESRYPQPTHAQEVK